MKIRIFDDYAGFRINSRRKVKALLEKVIRDSGRNPDDLNFILTDDNSVRNINVQFLEHDYFTDVITFDYNEGDIVKGEVYISIDTVRQNALNYGVSFDEELLRVMVHGALHLCGYDDSSDELRSNMRFMENMYLDKFKED